MSEERTQPEPGLWEWLAAVVCFVLGVLALAIGFLLTTDKLLDGHLHHSLHTLGIVLLIIGLPIIILGGHFMDLGEKKNGHVVLILIAVLFLSSTAHAQQTIFNVPSTDVLDRGKVYAELDASLKPTEGSHVPRFSSFVPRFVIGAGNSVEVGLNLTGNIQPGADSTTLVPTIKWRPFQSERGWAMVVGDNLFIPVRNRAYNAGNYVYAEMSKTLKSGTRITFGGYDFTQDVVATAQSWLKPRNCLRLPMKRLRDARGRLSIAERDRSGLVQQQRVHIAGGFDGAPRHRKYVVLDQTVHTRDTDRAQQSADRCWNQTHQQRDEDKDRLRGVGVDGEWLKGHNSQGRRHDYWVAFDWPAVFITRLFPVKTLGSRLRRECFVRFEPWANKSEINRSREGGRRKATGGESGQAGSDRSGDDLGFRARSAYFAGGSRVPDPACGTRTWNE